MNVMKRYNYFWLIVLMVWITGCSENVISLESKVMENDQLEVVDMVFDENYKNFHVDVKIKENYAPEKIARITDLKVVAKEFRMDFKELDDKAQPQFLGEMNVKSERIAEYGLKVLILVDLTLDEEQVQKQKIAINNLKSLFSHDNLYVAFMKKNTVSETYPVTDYVLENFFVSDTSHKRLYRSILSKLGEMNDKEDSLWASIPDSKKALVIFSDGRIYEDNKPIDSGHFDLQRQLVEKGKDLAGFPVCYVNFQNEITDEEEVDIENEAENIVTYLCNQTGGRYFPSFVWVQLSKQLSNMINVGEVDFRLYFSNPDYKVYRGIKRWLKIETFYKDSLIVSGHKAYSLGSIYHPIIVNGVSTWKVFVRGIVISLCMLVLVYLVLQFIVPRILYELFKRKHVTHYVGKNMSFHNIQVEESCYFCKAPFEKGEEIVAKCEHVMHKSCWDENEYKCPEYGRKCKEGSHYYNSFNLFDVQNAPYYMKWLLAGVMAGALSWCLFILNLWHIGYDSLVQMMFKMAEVDPNSEMAKGLMDKFGGGLYYTPYFGMYIGLFLTLFLSILSSHGKWWWKRSLFVLVKALLAGFCGYVTFVLTGIVSLALGLYGDTLLLDWIPWTLNGFVIAYVVSYKTDIKLRKALLGATVSILFGLGSMYIWKFYQNAQVDTRNLLLVSNMIYSIGLSLSLAFHFPRSERYFLRVEGAVKTMEIAIYKWMNAQVINRRITIGKSVDCNLQMSWDINSNIAPIQVEMVSERGNIYLIALEKGVYMDDKPVVQDKKIQLYHGDSFKIGQTLFTYVEHDI